MLVFNLYVQGLVANREPLGASDFEPDFTDSNAWVTSPVAHDSARHHTSLTDKSACGGIIVPIKLM